MTEKQTHKLTTFLLNNELFYMSYVDGHKPLMHGHLFVRLLDFFDQEGEISLDIEEE